jgi:hypothetical protein
VRLAGCWSCWSELALRCVGAPPLYTFVYAP